MRCQMWGTCCPVQKRTEQTKEQQQQSVNPEEREGEDSNQQA